MAKKWKNRQYRGAGFTLIEVAVSALIAMIIFVVSFNAISTSQTIQAQTSRSLRLAENARLFFSMLERDLSGAYPAWILENKSALVEHDKPTAKNDVLQFFARTDSINAAPDAVFLIRYYVAEKDSAGKPLHQIRRDVAGEYVTTGGPITVTIGAPSASLDDHSAAIFDEVHSLRFYFRKWNPDTKSFIPKLDDPNDLPAADVPDATHLLVRLFMRDDGRGNVKDAGVVLPRMFQKAIPLPGAFTK